jgi:hypothetical protein
MGVENNVVAALVLMAPPFVHFIERKMKTYFPTPKRTAIHHPGLRV